MEEKKDVEATTPPHAAALADDEKEQVRLYNEKFDDTVKAIEDMLSQRQMTAGDWYKIQAAINSKIERTVPEFQMSIFVKRT